MKKNLQNNKKRSGSKKNDSRRRLYGKLLVQKNARKDNRKNRAHFVYGNDF